MRAYACVHARTHVPPPNPRFVCLTQPVGREIIHILCQACAGSVFRSELPNVRVPTLLCE